jgi:hypothetical protein
MPAQSTPAKSSLKTPAKKYCPDGKVLNWSVVWPEARELEVLVMGGLLDGLTAAAVMEKYPLFKGFHYKPFASGLNNMRKKHNKEVADRAVHDTNGGQCKSQSWWSRSTAIILYVFILTRLAYFIDDGLKAHATATLVGNEALLDEVDEQTFAEDEDDVYDGMSHLSLGDDGTTG